MLNLLEIGQGVLAAQPFSAMLGTRMTAYADGAVELRLAIDDKVRQQHGFVHGGVLAYLADNALTFAGGLSLQRGGVLTSELKINYIRPAIGDELVARAATLSAGRTQAVCRCEIYVIVDGEERLCAAAQGTIVKTEAAKPKPA